MSDCGELAARSVQSRNEGFDKWARVHGFQHKALTARHFHVCSLHTGAIYETFGRENIELSICFIMARKIVRALRDHIGVAQ